MNIPNNNNGNKLKLKYKKQEECIELSVSNRLNYLVSIIIKFL